MTEKDTILGGGQRQFPATSWSILKQARRPSERTQALERLAGLYWKPVYCLIRHSWGKSNEEAKDLTQEFFLRSVLEGGLVEDFQGQSSFRTFLKSAVANFMKNARQADRAQKRGGNAAVLSIGEFDTTEILPDAKALPPDRVFDQAWKHLVLKQAMDLLARRLREQGQDLPLTLFERYDVDSTDASYRTLAEEFRLSVDDVKNHLTRARREFRQAVLDVVSDYVGGEKEIALEIAELFGV